MPSATNQSFSPVEVYRLLAKHSHWVIYPTILCGFLAAAFSFFQTKEWKSTQGLIIRPEVAGVIDQQLGKFSDLSEMKTIQETVLEVARSHSVISAALRDVGAPENHAYPEAWPTHEDVDGFRKKLSISPPKGAEFGKTEVFYVTILDNSPERAAAIVKAFCDQLEKRVKELRDERAQSMIAELQQGVEQAERDLGKQVQKLSQLETETGAYLGDLRLLHSSTPGNIELSQKKLAIETDLRGNASVQGQLEKLLLFLQSAEENPDHLIATPSTLLRSQTGLLKLKEGLLAAQLQTASLLSSRQEDHPYVIAAREAESQVRDQIHQELSLAAEGVELEITLTEQRKKELETKLAQTENALSNLASSRAIYSSLVNSVENHTQLVEVAHQKLAEVKSKQAGAVSASLIARIDEVESDVRPVGLGKAKVTLAGTLLGFIGGLGFIYLVHGPQPVVEVERSGKEAAPSQSHPETRFGFERPRSMADAIRTIRPVCIPANLETVS